MNILNFAPKEFSQQDRHKIFWRNGPCCRFCGYRMLGLFSIDSLYNGEYRKNEATIHHIVPISKGGLGFYSNGLACCIECHEKIHEFLAMFKINKRQYNLYTAFYVWLFMPHTSLMLKLRTRFSYTHYSKSLNGFARLFRKTLSRQSALTKMLVSFYVHEGACKQGSLAHEFISSSYDLDKLNYQLFKSKENIVEFRNGLFCHSKFFRELLAA